MKWRVIFISKDVNAKEIDLIYNLFLRCQSGDKSVLNYLFKRKDRKTGSINELIEEYRIKDVLDNALDPEMEKLSREYENVNNVTDTKNEDIVFAFDILNKMLYNMKRTYSKDSLETGYENGVEKEHRTYKKFHSGECDISELSEIMYEVMISIFQTELDGNGCATLNGKKNKVPIIDGVSLLKNISYFCCIQTNEGQSKRCNDIPGENIEDDFQSENISLFDSYSFAKWQNEENEKWNNQGEILRLLVYADILEWLRNHKDSTMKLFKKDSTEIQAIINTILSNEKVFENEIDGCLKLVKHKELQQLIYEHTGKMIVLTNISNDLKLIEQRIINHLFYSLNYRVGDDKKEQTGNKTNNGYLQELDKKRYLKLFGRESMFIYKICSLYLDALNKEKFLNNIREHDDAVIPILSLVKGKRKYDIINLIRCDLDVIDDDIPYDRIVTDIAQTLVCYYQEAETVKIAEFKKQYKFTDRFISGKSQMWEANMFADCLRIRFWADENTKHPVSYKINSGNLLIYEGYDNFYFCDASEMLCFLMPKGKRVIAKSDSVHNIFFDNIA